MTQITFWNTTIDDQVDLTGYSAEDLMYTLIDLVTHDVYNNGGQLHEESTLGKFYERVWNEMIGRMEE